MNSSTLVQRKWGIAELQSSPIGKELARQLLLNITMDQAVAQLANSNFLKRTAGVADTAWAAVFLASDGAGMMTGTVVNATASAAMD